ncbi:hypothetical protein ACEQ8H_005310 [Pleosporales sp. CAS-2024a]
MLAHLTMLVLLAAPLTAKIIIREGQPPQHLDCFGRCLLEGAHAGDQKCYSVQKDKSAKCSKLLFPNNFGPAEDEFDESHEHATVSRSRAQ